jgi:hypothetical protein
MNSQTPCSSSIETLGIVYFARMLDKIRLKARELLPAEYNMGFSDPTSFDARFCRFWEFDYTLITATTLAGGSDEEILKKLFEGRKFPNEEQILVWNAFLTKRGWRDSGTAGLVEKKKLAGWSARKEIQTWVDLHDAEEGRPLRFAE